MNVRGRMIGSQKVFVSQIDTYISISLSFEYCMDESYCTFLLNKGPPY